MNILFVLNGLLLLPLSMALFVVKHELILCTFTFLHSKLRDYLLLTIYTT